MKKKNNVIEFGIILVITLLLCQNFLQMHYSSDTYVLYKLGYFEYPSKYFLLDGRLISTIVCYLAGILLIPIESYIVGMDFIGIVFVALAIYLIKNLFESFIKPQNMLTKVCITAASFILILNQFTLEYLLFPESAVMCLGLFLNVVATCIIFSNKKYKYIKIFFVLLIGALCYQGLLNIFPILAITTYIVKQIVDTREYKIKEKEFLIEMIKLAVIVVLVLVICLSVVKIGKNLLNSTQDRMMHLKDLEAVMFRAETVSEYMDELWNYSMGMLPKHFSTIMLVISAILLFVLRTQKEIVLQYILLLVIGFTICIIPMFIFNSGPCGRVNVPLMMLWGASLIILLAQSTILEQSVKTKIISVFIVVSFIINSIYIMQNITEHIAANRVDENTGNTIKYAIEKYEEETGNTITKLSYVYDKNPQQYALGIKPMGSLTERKFACSWCVKAAMEYYCQRGFEIVVKSTPTIEELVQKDYTQFSEEQLIFNEDTLCMIIY